MILREVILTIAFLLAIALGHDHKSGEKSGTGIESIDASSRWKSGYTFTGINTFAHLPHIQCLVEQDAPFDLAVIGVPFDTSVAYRTGIKILYKTVIQFLH